MKIISAKIKFEPRDIWIGVYWNKVHTIAKIFWLDLYICVIPLLPIKITIRDLLKIEEPDYKILSVDVAKRTNKEPNESAIS